MTADPRPLIETGLRSPVAVQGEPVARATLRSRMAQARVPGLSLAVIDQGAVAFAAAYGVRAAGDALAVTPATLFQAASLSKPVAALAALRLAAAGQLDLDAALNRYLRTWRLPANDFTRQQLLTVRHLLTHTGGVTVHGFAGYPLGAPLPTLVEMLDGLPPANHAAIRVDQLPGSAQRYSGGGYLILQQLLQDLTGETYAALLQRLVFAPLGMRRSGYAVPDPADALVALGHTSAGAVVPASFRVHPEYAPAGLWTTPTDYAFFALAIMRAFNGERDALLPLAWAQAMLSPQAPAADQGLGPGLTGAGEWLGFLHGGSNYGYRCFFIAYPRQGQGVVVMTNGERGTALTQAVVRAVAEAYGWPGYAPVVRVPAPTPVPASWAGYAGRYVLVNYPTASLTIQPAADRLTFTLDDDEGLATGDLWPGANGRFFRRDADFEVEFEPAAGAPTALVGYWEDHPQRALRARVS